MRATYLSAQLREAPPYLRDAGWRETASLLVAAADEVERLQQALGPRADHAPENGSRTAQAREVER